MLVGTASAPPVYQGQLTKGDGMRKLLLLAAAAALVAPASALAKEVTKLEVCGASGCNSTTDRAVLERIGEGSNGESTIAAPDLQPYYRLVYTVQAEPETFQFTNFYIPGAKATRGVDQRGYTHFYPVSPEFADSIESLARGLEPFPKPQILRVTIGRKVAADPASYERLLTLKARERYTATTDWRRIKFAT